MSKEADKIQNADHSNGQGLSPQKFTPPTLPVFFPISRLGLLNQAKRLAIEQVENNATLTKPLYEQFCHHEPHVAIRELAERILNDAATSIHVPEPNTTGAGKPKLVTLGHMARKAGVTTKWLRSEADAGRLPCLKAGDRLLFSPDAVIDILSQRAAQYQPKDKTAACCGPAKGYKPSRRLSEATHLQVNIVAYE